MKATLVVKNFGPIKDAELDLRNVNVFIGPQASGKSTLAKLYQICRAPLKFCKSNTTFGDGDLESEDSILFLQELKKYNIDSFLSDSSYIKFTSITHSIEYSKGIFKLTRVFLSIEKELNLFVEKNDVEKANEFVETYLRPLFSSIFMFETFVEKENVRSGVLAAILKTRGKLDISDILKLKDKIIKLEIALLNNSTYIPTERLFIPIIMKSVLNLIANDVPIPKHILNFGVEYEKAINDIHGIDISFLDKNLKFKNINGIPKLFYKSGESILLSQSASGIQSLIPLLSVIEAGVNKRPSNLSYIIEEPELNLFPKAQYSLIKHLERKRQDGEIDNTYSHLYTTHSPYILSSFNNMLYAFKKAKKIELETKKQYQRINFDAILGGVKDEYDDLTKILPKENWLNPDNFNAYTIKDGTAIQIFDRELGLIRDNVIDEASDEMNDDFERLLDI